jgi:soluble lytic murein transglycosylase-like protein
MPPSQRMVLAAGRTVFRHIVRSRQPHTHRTAASTIPGTFVLCSTLLLSGGNSFAAIASKTIDTRLHAGHRTKNSAPAVHYDNASSPDAWLARRARATVMLSPDDEERERLRVAVRALTLTPTAFHAWLTTAFDSVPAAGGARKGPLAFKPGPLSTVPSILTLVPQREGPSARTTVNQTARGLEPRVVALSPIVVRIARQQGVDSALLMAIIHVESKGNPNAVSVRGARGLMQIMPRTGAAYGARNLFDQQQNIRTGARHLNHLLVSHDGRVELAIAAYNAGSGAIRRHGMRVPPYPETQRYVRKVLAYQSAYRQLAG